MTACDTAKTCFNPIDLAPAFAHIWNRLPVTTWVLRFPSIRSNSKIMAQGEAITVSSLHIYPVKSCAGLQLQQAQVTPTGGKITWLPHFTRFGSSCDGPPCCGILGCPFLSAPKWYVLAILQPARPHRLADREGIRYRTLPLTCPSVRRLTAKQVML